VRSVVTVAGNLDIHAWAGLHHYTRLADSVNPAAVAAPERGFGMIHYAGSRDRNTPVALIEASAARIGGRVVVIEGFTHSCCWEGRWPPETDGQR